MTSSSDPQSILIVDDSPLLRILMSASLQRFSGLSVTEAHNGVEALKFLKENQYSLIITDINMPVMDGIKLVKYVRSEPKHESTPIIVVSTESDVNNVEQVVKLGIQSYLTKPVAGDEIIEAVQKILNL